MMPTIEKIRPWVLRHRTVVMIALNLGLVTFAYFFAFALRFDLRIPHNHLVVLLATLPLLLACKAIAFWYSGLFSGSWRHVNMSDVVDLARGNLIGSSVFLGTIVFLRGLAGFPRSVFLIDMLVCTGLMAGVRLGIRLARERKERSVPRCIETLALIVGAGSAGIRLLEEIESRRRLKLAVVGFVDDDPAKLGLRVCGTPVLGTVDDLPRLITLHDVTEVLIAIPSATGAVLKRIVEHCNQSRVRHRVLPTLGELVEGRVMYTQMREVKVDDLLARPPVKLDLPRVQSLITGKRVLVTGAAGSIGSELCRQLAVHRPERIVLYDRHENGIFTLEMELRARFPELHIEPLLGDVLLEDQLRTVFAEHRPELVFHAAAYKHVPIAERNLIEAVRNNVLGTRNVTRAALAAGTKEFVLVSTDKAVSPTSVMGVTKRVAEMVVQGMQNGGCRFVAVRFGNVLGSSGSVVPLFRDQIARGGPVTVTDPLATRYFMTIPEAAQLILHAAALAMGGEIFILEMGEPVKIVDLARQLIRLSGFEPDEDISISFTGLRPGEKLHEELMSDDEECAASAHDQIRVLRSNGHAPVPDDWLAQFADLVEAGDIGSIVWLLQQLVPAYRPSEPLGREMAEWEERAMLAHAFQAAAPDHAHPPRECGLPGKPDGIEPADDHESPDDHKAARAHGNGEGGSAHWPRETLRRFLLPSAVNTRPDANPTVLASHGARPRASR